jgi:hypothetical protein
MNILALVFSVPTAYFILISILKYGLGVDGPFDSMQPFLEKLGIDKNFGWNINLLIVFGPVFAFCLTAYQVVRLKWHFSKEELEFQLRIKKNWFPLGIAIFSACLVLMLMVYFAGENLMIRV